MHCTAGDEMESKGTDTSADVAPYSALTTAAQCTVPWCTAVCTGAGGVCSAAQCAGVDMSPVSHPPLHTLDH